MVAVVVAVVRVHAILEESVEIHANDRSAPLASNRPQWLRCSAFLPFKEGKRAVAGRENVSRESEAVELCPRVTTTTR